MSEFKVAVRCLCYNHAPFVKKTLDGLSSQKTNFKYLAIIIDDASTDGTQNVIKKYIDDNFTVNDNSNQITETEDTIIYYLNHKTNKNFYISVLFLKYNFFQIHKSKEPIISKWLNKAEYWAICECDDYWIYDKKLQEEVEFLDNNTEYGLVYTDFDIEKYDTGEYIRYALKNGIKPTITSFEQHLVNKAYIAPMSWVCSIPYYDLLNSYKGPPSIDTSFILALEAFLHSKVHYMDKVTCVYGVHSGSATKQTSLNKQYEYSYGVYSTQKYYLERFNLRNKYPDCLDYFINAYYCFIISNKIEEEYAEVQNFFYKKRKSSCKFYIFYYMMKTKATIPILRMICKLRIYKQK